MWWFCGVGLPRVAVWALFSQVTDECRCRGLPVVAKHGRDSDIGTSGGYEGKLRRYTAGSTARPYLDCRPRSISIRT